MKQLLPDGVWPTMITPFTEKGEMDFVSLKRLVDWYIEQDVDGLFAVCQSSEMFFLTLEEKRKLAEATVAAAAGRVPVICSGHTSDSPADQMTELQAMASTGVDAVVLITNRLAGEDEGDEIFISNLDRLVTSLPVEMPLGFYECPFPYKRLLSEEALRYSLKAGRFTFLKDTSCDSQLMVRRLELMRGSPFKLFNANAPTLSLSLAAGGNGYSGVMANFHPRHYKELLALQMRNPGSGDSLQNLLGALSAIEDYWYPMTAKYHLKNIGVIESAFTRKHASSVLDENHRMMVNQMQALMKQFALNFNKPIV